MHSNSCISWRNSFKFCMEVYLGKIYMPLVFGNVAPSVPSFIGSNVIFWWKSCVRSAGHISWWISFKFCTDEHHSQIYTPIVFDDAAPSVPSVIGSKVILVLILVCALTAAYFSGYLSCVRSAGHISWQISFECCIEVHYRPTLIYTHIFWWCYS